MSCAYVIPCCGLTLCLVCDDRDSVEVAIAVGSAKTGIMPKEVPRVGTAKARSVVVVVVEAEAVEVAGAVAMRAGERMIEVADAVDGDEVVSL